jgi:hypothetical protein
VSSIRQIDSHGGNAIRQRRYEADLFEKLEFHRAIKRRELEESGII